EIKDMAIAVSSYPRPIVDELCRRDQGPREVEAHVREPRPCDAPAGDRVVGDVRVDEVQVVRVVERQIAFIAELVLLDRHAAEARRIDEALSAVDGRPYPRHAARERR